MHLWSNIERILNFPAIEGYEMKGKWRQLRSNVVSYYDVRNIGIVLEEGLIRKVTSTRLFSFHRDSIYKVLDKDRELYILYDLKNNLLMAEIESYHKVHPIEHIFYK